MTTPSHRDDGSVPGMRDMTPCRDCGEPMRDTSDDRRSLSRVGSISVVQQRWVRDQANCRFLGVLAGGLAR